MTPKNDVSIFQRKQSQIQPQRQSDWANIGSKATDHLITQTYQLQLQQILYELSHFYTIKFPSPSITESKEQKPQNLFDFKCLINRENSLSMVQHGMEMQNISYQDDSGFGSGGSYFSTQPTHVNDLDILERNMKELVHSGCYFGSMDSTSARKLLKKASMGTFLIRDSSDSNFLYSLSVKTERGATSVRIVYDNGLFQFDSDKRVRQHLPQFESVLSLVDFHTKLSRDGKNKNWRWEENSGKKFMKVMLTDSLKSSVSSLAHLSRVKINQCLDNVHIPAMSVDRLPMLPVWLKEYLREYPYRV